MITGGGGAVAETDWFKTAQSLAEQWDFYHWKLAFPEVFYEKGGELKEGGGFDAVIGNPPYVSNWKLTEMNEHLPDHLENLYPDVAVGHWDFFVPFCYRAVSLTSQSGYQSFITPTSLATEKYARELRDFLIKECQLESLVNFGEHRVFNHVDRQYVVYIVSPTSRNEECQIVTYDGVDFRPEYTIDPREFLEYSNSMLRIDISQRDISIKNKIEKQSIRTGHLCCVNPGVVAHSAKDSPLDFNKDDVIVGNPSSNAVKYLSGKDIDRHQIVWGGKYMEYYKHQKYFHRPKFPDLFESPKIMFSGISSEKNRIKSVYDSEGYFTNHNINHATLWRESIQQHHSSADYEIADNVEKYNMKYISAIVNSTLMAYYFSNFLATGTLQGSYSSVYPENIRQLPIKILPDSVNLSDSGTEGRALMEKGEEIEKLETLPKILNQKDTSIETLANTLVYLLVSIREASDERGTLSLDLRTYLSGYSQGSVLPEVASYQPGANPESILHSTKQDYKNLRIGTVTCERETESTVVVHATARYKPDDEDAHKTDQWGYTETEPIPAMRLMDLSETEADLVEAFVPVAVEKAGGFAGFRETATKTNSLIDRLEAITLPDPDDVADDLDRYNEAVERAAELDEKIQQTDDLIDEIVYELYGLTEEEIEIVEESV
ncbi:MAG: TaqI-like C-terminal specificity domain-containing protein [Halodesulfurarchaeum sp.]|nr:TaqI-like C-terminal specificity domain-containing protein [Halodesulfurarchaeum sp.]